MKPTCKSPDFPKQHRKGQILGLGLQKRDRPPEAPAIALIRATCLRLADLRAAFCNLWSLKTNSSCNHQYLKSSQVYSGSFYCGRYRLKRGLGSTSFQGVKLRQKEAFQWTRQMSNQNPTLKWRHLGPWVGSLVLDWAALQRDWFGFAFLPCPCGVLSVKQRCGPRVGRT